MERIITLTTDFGLKDAYQGAMTGAILSINPAAKIVEISRNIPPGRVMEGAFVMRDACLFFPKGTVHVGVVDPGVGGWRKPVLIETERYFFVGPDNGLLTLAAEKDNIKRVVELAAKKYFLREIGNTFHGRDVFGPVSAHLSLGVKLTEFGPLLKRCSSLNLPRPKKRGRAITGTVVYADSFGNLITNIREEDIAGMPKKGALKAVINGTGVMGINIRGLKRTYSDAPEGEPVILIGSSGHLEIAVNGGSAEKVLKTKAGCKVTLYYEATGL